MRFLNANLLQFAETFGKIHAGGFFIRYPGTILTHSR